MSYNSLQRDWVKNLNENNLFPNREYKEDPLDLAQLFFDGASTSREIVKWEDITTGWVLGEEGSKEPCLCQKEEQ